MRPCLEERRNTKKQNPGIKIHWDRRTLREFGEAPIEQYLDRYDLLIVDHPFVGFAAAHGVLVDLAPSISEAEKLRCAADSVGPSWESYWYGDGLWAFPIDAATQVASYRPDLLVGSVSRCSEHFRRCLGTRKESAQNWEIYRGACLSDGCDQSVLHFERESRLPHPRGRRTFRGRLCRSRSAGSPSCAHCSCPSQIGGVESDPGLRFHDQGLRGGLLSVRFRIFQLLASWRVQCD